MNIFVAGATGFIGSAACRALAGAGHTVTGLARSREKAALLERQSVRVLLGSLDEPESFAGRVGRPDAVIHLAATWFDGGETAEKAKGISARIAAWTRTLARIAKEAGSRAFVLASTSGMYGDRQGAATTEDAPHRPTGFARIVEGSEQMLAEIGGREQVPAISIMPTWVYGAGSWFPDLVREIRTGRTTYLIDGGENLLGFVHVDDVGELFRLAAEKGEPGSRFNVTDDTAVSVHEFVEATSRALGVPMPRGVSRREALEEHGDLWVEALTTSARLDTAAAKNRLGWRPRYPSLREGLPAALRALSG